MPFLRPSRTRALRRRGDQYRDQRLWSEAAETYRRHLEQEPQDYDIWVQLGHAEKEQGRHEEAVGAYRQATTVDSDNADARLHLAHLLKQMGEREEALIEFREVFLLSSAPEAMVEMEQLIGSRRLQEEKPSDAAILFSVEDLFHAFHHHPTITGIQRVEVATIAAALDRPDVEALFFVNGPLLSGRQTYLRVSKGSMAGIIAQSGAPFTDHDRMRTRLTEARLSATPIRLDGAAAIVMLGPFWEPGNRIEQFVEAQSNGVRLIVFVHDLIPLTHPEYCVPELSNAFWRSVASLVRQADAIISNSQHTRAAFAALLDQIRRRPGLRVVPLALSPSADNPDLPAAFRKLLRRPYVAYVSTLEGRKNHIYVVEAWRRMIAAGVKVPDLLFVGRAGWKNEALRKLLRDTNDLRGRVHILHDLSDAELGAVYKGAMFTVFTSFVEGWGLPVGESLAHGTPCVASRVASIPEVGGPLVDYVDPDDLDDGIRAFRRMIEDPAYLAQRRADIAEQYRPRSWERFGDELVMAIVEEVQSGYRPSPLFLPPLSEGRVLDLGARGIAAAPCQDYLKSPIELALVRDFHELTSDGAWIRRSPARLAFEVTGTPGEPIVCFLQLYAGGLGGTRRVMIHQWSEYAVLPRGVRLDGGINWIRFDGIVPNDRLFTFVLSVEGGLLGDDLRSQGIALRRIGYCRATDLHSRRALRKRMVA